METARDRVLARAAVIAALGDPMADPVEEYAQQLDDLAQTVADHEGRLGALEEAAVQNALEGGDWAVGMTAALPDDLPPAEVPEALPEPVEA